MSPSEKISPREAIVFGKFTLFPTARSLECEGAPLALGSRAMEILCLLLERAGTVVSKKELIARAWPHVTVVESGLKVQVASLRRILGDGQDGNRYIATVNGRGYSFVAPTERRGGPSYAALAVPPAAPHEVSSDSAAPASRDEIFKHLSTYVSKYRLLAIKEASGKAVGTVAVMDEVVAALESAIRLVGQNHLDKIVG